MTCSVEGLDECLLHPDELMRKQLKCCRKSYSFCVELRNTTESVKVYNVHTVHTDNLRHTLFLHQC